MRPGSTPQGALALMFVPTHTKGGGSSRIRNIQTQMTERALELLAFPDEESKFILDIGCGSVFIFPRAKSD